MRDYQFTIAAQSSVRIGTLLRFVHVQSTTGDLTIQWNAGASRVVSGVGRTFPLMTADGAAVTDLELLNETSSSIDVTVTAGPEYERLDASAGNSQITGPLGANNAVAVEDKGSGDSFADLVSLLQNAADQRAALTTFAGAVYNEVSNATVTIVSSSNNTNGVVIALAGIQHEDDARGPANVEISGNKIVGSKFYENRFRIDWIRDLFVGPGDSVVLRAPEMTYVWAWTRTL